MARAFITEDAKILLAEPTEALNEDIVVKQVTNPSEDDECHVAFTCDILDGDTHEKATGEVLDYINKIRKDDMVESNGELHLELWTQSSTEDEIKEDIKNYIEGHYDAYSLFVPTDSIKILNAELWRYPDYDEINKVATKKLMKILKEKQIPGIEFTDEKPDGFYFKTDGAEIWYQAETADVIELTAALREAYFESHKALTEEKYSDGAFATIEDAFESAGIEFERFNEAGILSKNLGWVLNVDGSRVILSADGTWLDESKKITESQEEKPFELLVQYRGDEAASFVDYYKTVEEAEEAARDDADVAHYQVYDESGAIVAEDDWDDTDESLKEAHGRGFVEKYKGYSIHDAGDRYVITDENGTSVEETKWGLPICRAIIDELVEKKQVKEDLPDAQPAEPITVDTTPEPDEEIKKNAIVAQLNSAIQREFEGIDAINGLIAMVKENLPERSDIVGILDTIVNDKSFTVGVIQGAIAKVDPKMSEMNDAGKTQVTGEPVPTDATAVVDNAIEGE